MYKLICMCMLVITSGIAQESPFSKIDTIFHLLEKKDAGMGSFSIFKDGNEVYHTSFGLADISKDKKNDKNTMFRIGSITKTFTAVVIMQLISEGKIARTTPLKTYFNKIPNAEKITVEDLLRHQSGLYNITNDETIRDWVIKKQSKEAMLSRIIKKKPDFEPKAQTAYSNTNYILLSYIAEEIEKKEYQEILFERIIEPLQLKNTFMGIPEIHKKNMALPYYKNNGSWFFMENTTHLENPKGAGGIISTPTEINTFYTALFSNKLISKTSLSEMITTNEGVGIGIMELPFEDIEIYGHGGSIDTYQSFVAYLPVQKISMAITTNALEGHVSETFIQAGKILMGIE